MSAPEFDSTSRAHVHAFLDAALGGWDRDEGARAAREHMYRQQDAGGIRAGDRIAMAPTRGARRRTAKGDVHAP